jgi:choline dehydrogenase
VAFLHPAMERRNLTVEPWMHVNRVLFEGTRAVGVEAQRLGEAHRFEAEREVILSGGAYNSPQLLMLSGVGPAEHLTLREVEVVCDLPQVGENLSDHPQVSNVWTATEPCSLLLALEPAALEEFNERASGPLTSNLAEAGGFIRTRADLDAPDVQLHVAPVMIVDEGLADPPDHGLWASPCVLQPESRGSVTLASNDPTAKPVIRHNYYASEQDMRTMIEGMRVLLHIVGQPALGPYCADPFLAPGGDDDQALRAHIARNTVTIYHPVGTCALGTVVDAELRVLGTEALRVVDASVMPAVPRGNTNAPTIAIAERAADLLRGREPATAAGEPAVASPGT